MNVLGYTRKAATLLNDIAEWNLTATDGTIADLTHKDIMEIVKLLKKANLLVEKAYTDAMIRHISFKKCPNKTCKFYAKHKGAHGG